MTSGSLKMMSFAEAEAHAKASETIDWLWPGIIPSTGYTMLVGEPLAGKSLLLSVVIGAAQAPTDETASLAGRNVLQTRWLYVHLEHLLTPHLAHIRAAARAHAGVEPFTINFLTDFDLDDDAFVDEVAKLADDQHINVIVIDSLRRATLGQENSSDDTVRWGQRIARLTGGGKRLVIAVHHLAKGGNGGPRGSTDLKSQVDSLVTVRRIGEGIRVTAEHHHAPQVELRLRFVHDPQAGTLELVEDDTPQKPAGPTAEQNVRKAMLAVLAEHPGVGTRELSKLVTEKVPGGVRKETVAAARDNAEEAGLIVNQGSGNQHKWFLAPQTPVSPAGSLST